MVLYGSGWLSAAFTGVPSTIRQSDCIQRSQSPFRFRYGIKASQRDPAQQYSKEGQHKAVAVAVAVAVHCKQEAVAVAVAVQENSKRNNKDTPPERGSAASSTITCCERVASTDSVNNGLDLVRFVSALTQSTAKSKQTATTGSAVISQKTSQ